MFSTKSDARILNLNFLLQSTKKGSSIIEDYFLEMKFLAHDLVLFVLSVFDGDLILFILSGLGPEYEFVVINLTSKDSVTLPKAQFILQTHEARLKAFHSTLVINTSHVTAYFAHKLESPCKTPT